MLITSILALLCLAIRYPFMNQSVVLQIGIDGQPAKTMDKSLFGICFVLMITGVNIYLFLLRKKGREILWRPVLIYAGLCAIVLFVTVF